MHREAVIGLRNELRTVEAPPLSTNRGESLKPQPSGQGVPEAPTSSRATPRGGGGRGSAAGEPKGGSLLIPSHGGAEFLVSRTVDRRVLEGGEGKRGKKGGRKY